MKIFLSVLLTIITCTTIVHAQEEEADLAGLSESRCKWVHIQETTMKDASGKDILAWEECKAGSGTLCVWKFCSGAAEGEKWKKGQCNKYCITLQEKIPIGGLNVRSIAGDSGVDLLGNYFGLWYKIGALVLGLIGVLVIVISGVQITFGGASEDGVSGAKTRIWAAILSLILLFSSALILQTINPLFFT